MHPLAVAGNVNVDLIMGPAAPWPTPGTEIIVDHDELRVGGAAGNSALVWRALGIDFQIAANTGADQFGDWLRNAFQPHAETWPVAATGTTLSVGITHPNGERTFFTTRGHLPSMNFEQVRDMLDAGRLAGGYLLLCGGFLTEGFTASYDALFDWADAHDIRVVLDTGWPLDGWTAANKASARSWLSRCHVMLMNEVEATTLADTPSPEEAARCLREIMPNGAIAVVKCGPDGALGINGNGDTVFASAPQVEVADTIGAGDVFNAAFLVALAHDLSLDDCLTAGVQVASKAVSTNPRRYDGHTLSFLSETSR